MSKENHSWIENKGYNYPESDGTYLVVLRGWNIATTLDFDEGDGWDCYDDS